MTDENERDGRSKTRLYKTYYNIRDRCYNPKHRSYCYYGGRGIKMCDEWKNSFNSFEEWSLVNGYDPALPGALNSIDRIDPNGDYAPDNCRWITMREQAANKRNTIRITINGETHTLPEWAQITGVEYATLHRRFRYGKRPAEDLLRRETSKLYVASDGKKYTTGQIAEIAGTTSQQVWYRLNIIGRSVDEVLAGKTRFLRYTTNDGQTRSLHQIADDTGIDYCTLWRRIKVQGKTLEEAVSRDSFQVGVYTDAAGRPYTISELMSATGEKRCTIWARLNRDGWSVEECLAGYRTKQVPVCSICGQRAKGHELCNKHLIRLRKYGNPMVTAFPKEPGEIALCEWEQQHNTDKGEQP